MRLGVCMTNDLNAMIEQFDVISIAVIDTLLIRNVLNPKGVWRILEQNEFAHRRYAPIDTLPGCRVRTKLVLLGIPVLKVRYEWKDGWNCRTLLLLGKFPLLCRKTQVYKLAKIRKAGESICV